MKKAILPLVVLVMGITAAVMFWAPLSYTATNILYYSLCDTPITYKVGTVDPRFHVTTTEFQQDISQAVSIWDSVNGKDLFTFDPQGTLTVSLVYDTRQALTTQINELQDQLQKEKNSLDPAIAAFQQQEVEFNKKVENLNAKIHAANEKGGAELDEYNALIQERALLQNEAEKLTQEAKDLNQSTHIYNGEVGQLNNTVDSFNKVLARKPEEGVYDSATNSITIFFSSNQNELIHTLAHELGHARGLDHNMNEESIMFAYTTQALTPSLTDIENLNQICAKRSIFQKMRNNFNFLLHNVLLKENQQQ